MNPAKVVIVATWLACGSLAAPSASGAGRSAEESIREGSASFLAAYTAGDVDAVLSQFEDNAVVMPPGLPPLRGRAEIRQFVEKGTATFKANGISLALGAGSEVGVSGSLGWHSGPFAVSKSGTIIDAGKYLETWHKSGSQWRMIRRIWNSNLPPAAPAPVK